MMLNLISILILILIDLCCTAHIYTFMYTHSYFIIYTHYIGIITYMD